jgi:hypothetical protein
VSPRKLPEPLKWERLGGEDESVLVKLERFRHRIPFWWWLTYDALVALVIAVGIAPSSPAFWIGYATLAIAVVIDVVEFIVKRPSARAKLREIDG